MDGALCLGFYLSLTHTHVGGGRARREEVHARRTYSVSFPTTLARVHDGAHFYTKKAAHVVIWHVYWLSTWWREDRLPRVNKQIAT